MPRFSLQFFKTFYTEIFLIVYKSIVNTTKTFHCNPYLRLNMFLIPKLILIKQRHGLTFPPPRKNNKGAFYPKMIGVKN